MARSTTRQACIVGIGTSPFGRRTGRSPLSLCAEAFKAAMADSGLMREDIDGLSLHLGSPAALDYDRVAEGLGLEIRYVNQAWSHGRFVTMSLQHAALAVGSGPGGRRRLRDRDLLHPPQGDGRRGRYRGHARGRRNPWRVAALRPDRPRQRRSPCHAALHARPRRHVRTAGSRADSLPQARVPEPGGTHADADDAGGPPGLPHGRRSAAPAGLLPDDRRSGGGVRDDGGACQGPGAAPRPHHRHARDTLGPGGIHLRPARPRACAAELRSCPGTGGRHAGLPGRRGGARRRAGPLHLRRPSRPSCSSRSSASASAALARRRTTCRAAPSSWVARCR